jgi:6-methylsalicylate decarboxylase
LDGRLDKFDGATPYKPDREMLPQCVHLVASSHLNVMHVTNMSHPYTPPASTRRQLLKAAASLGALASGNLLSSVTRAGVPLTRIDVHAHLIPNFYRQALHDHQAMTASGQPMPAWSPAAALDFMDKFGIQAQVVSLPEPGLAFLPDLPSRVKMAQQLNDFAREELVYAGQANPNRGRFGAFATLPLGDPNSDRDVAAAQAEANRAILQLGLDGVVLYTSYRGIYLGDTKLAPLMRALNRLGARVMVIPVAPPVAPPDPSGLSIPLDVLELPFETTRVATNLLYKLAYTLYPRIRWQFSEGGGATPFLSFRSGLLSLHLNPNKSAYADLYFDTATATAPAMVASMRQVTEVSHILLGTDFPYSAELYADKSAGDPNVELNLSFNAADRQKVDRANALAQFPTLAKRLMQG